MADGGEIATRRLRQALLPRGSLYRSVDQLWMGVDGFVEEHEPAGRWNVDGTQCGRLRLCRMAVGG